MTQADDRRPSISPLAPSPKRVLLLLVAGIGDFVMATPAIRAIAQGFPTARRVFLTTPQNADLARNCPHLHQVLTFDLRAYRPGERGTGWRGWQRFWTLSRDLRLQQFDLVVNLYQVATWGGALRMGLLLARIGALHTAGRWSGGRGVMFDLRSTDHRHEVDAMLGLAGVLGCPLDDVSPRLWIPEAARIDAACRLREAGLLASTPYAVLNVGSNRPEARLPAEKATEIGRLVGAMTKGNLFVSGDRNEAPLADTVVRQIGGNARSLAGRTSLLELAAILERASLMITTDSGPMHIAAALGTPLVVLFGPADPGATGPRGQPGRTVILQGHLHPRDPGRWHADITPAEVADAAQQVLNFWHPVDLL